MRARFTVALILALIGMATSASAAERIKGFGGYMLYGTFTRQELRGMRGLPYNSHFNVPGVVAGSMMGRYFAEGFRYQRTIRIPSEGPLPALVTLTVLNGSICDITVDVIFSRAAVGEISHEERAKRTKAAFEFLCAHAAKRYGGSTFDSADVQDAGLDEERMLFYSARNSRYPAEWVDLVCYPELYKVKIEYMTALSQGWMDAYYGE